MDGLTDFRKRLEEIRAAVLENLPRIAEVVAVTAKGLAERRMKEHGFGIIYSNNPVPAWFFHGKELNQRGTAFLEKHGVHPKTGAQGEGKKKRRAKKGDADPGSFLTTTTWGEFRVAQGLQAAFIDLSYSNKMWAAMSPISVEEAGGIVRALLGANNREAQNKMNWNFERYGDFIQKSLNEEDGKLLGEVVISEVSDVVHQLK